jgi:hypothetical protein
VQGHCYWAMRRRRRSRAWAGTQQSIETRVALECEREHQEHLLLSVMPAYIAAEVRSGRGGIVTLQYQIILLQLHSATVTYLFG